ncbi:MAG: hypothetical protein E7254_02060 [Lachnospiraceae bacterium]|nr:hypothetical protein [Lachnospiraceae bacterium]
MKKMIILLMTVMTMAAFTGCGMGDTNNRDNNDGVVNDAVDDAVDGVEDGVNDVESGVNDMLDNDATDNNR